MTKADAKKLVCRVAAKTIWNDKNGVGASWIYDGDDGDPRPPEDTERIEQAIDEFVAEMERRAATPGR